LLLTEQCDAGAQGDDANHEHATDRQEHVPEKMALPEYFPVCRDLEGGGL